jgi:hypothetical protein
MIYFIQDTVTRAIKIGYSTNPQKRLPGQSQISGLSGREIYAVFQRLD